MSDEARRETDEAAGMYADTDVNSQNGSQAGSQPAGDGVPATFDTDRFLAGLDAIYEAHEAPTKAEPYLQQAMADAENAGNDAGLLTVLNEIMGFYRSQGRHDENQWIVQRAIELGLRLQLPGSEAWTTTLINAATAMRAAGRYDQAQDLYHQALESAKSTMPAHDRRLAALHNNLSMLYSETGRPTLARHELETALRILETASTDISTDLDAASTHTNLALVLLQETLPGNGTEHHPDPTTEAGDSTQSPAGASDATRPDHVARHTDEADRERGLAEARRHASAALAIYRAGHLGHSAHYASALAGYAQVCFASADFRSSVDAYRHALAVIEECYGTDTDYYRTTAANLHDAQVALDHATPDPATPRVPSRGTATPEPGHQPPHALHTPQHPPMKGMALSRTFWEQCAKPMVERRHPRLRGRVAAGLIGHGSECYGFDNEQSHDHDFGPGCCLWLTDEDYRRFGADLQADYDALPETFMGYGPRESTARAQGPARRVGVFAIGDFFAGITGYRAAPTDDRPHEWLMLDEATLAAATNGEVFADPLGALLSTRQGFKTMPDDVRLSLISKRLGMIAQAGQYNLPRMLKRGDGAAAWLAVNACVEAAASLVFLINTPITAGYMPFYKWRFAALRRLSGRMATRLSDVGARLERILALSSATCFGGAGFGEGGKGSAPAQADVHDLIEGICRDIVAELHRQGLSDADETFLEWQRPYVEAHITSADPVLHSL